MNQDKSQTEGVETEGADPRAEAAPATAADRSDPAGGAASPAREERADAARPRQVGKRNGKEEGGGKTDQGDAKPPKAKTKGDSVPASKAKSDTVPPAAPASSKLDLLVAHLRAPGGATLPELQSATGWQVHSVRGAMAGALRKKGYSITSEKPEGGLRRYRITEAS